MSEALGGPATPTEKAPDSDALREAFAASGQPVAGAKEEPDNKRSRRTPSAERLVMPKMGAKSYADAAELPDFWERLEQKGKSKGKGKGKGKGKERPQLDPDQKDELLFATADVAYNNAKSAAEAKAQSTVLFVIKSNALKQSLYDVNSGKDTPKDKKLRCLRHVLEYLQEHKVDGAKKCLQASNKMLDGAVLRFIPDRYPQPRFKSWWDWKLVRSSTMFSQDLHDGLVDLLFEGGCDGCWIKQAPVKLPGKAQVLEKMLFPEWAAEREAKGKGKRHAKNKDDDVEMGQTPPVFGMPRGPAPGQAASSDGTVGRKPDEDL